MLKTIAAVSAAFLFLALASAPAAAEAVSDGKVVAPWGEWVGALAGWAGVVVVAGGGWLLRKLPTAARIAAEGVARVAFAASVDQLLERAVSYGVNAVSGAAKGKALTIDVGNRVVERAADYALQHAPKIVAQIGGMTRLREKLIARLDLDEAAAVSPVAQAIK